MTFVGHILMGETVGVALLPPKKTKKWKTLYFIILGLIANTPDFQLPFWGHHRYYYVSHSIFANSLLILLFMSLFAGWKKLRDAIGGWKTVAAGSLAWLSHLLLDTFYNQEKGLMMFWPVSEARLRLALPWFSVVKTLPPPITPDHIKIALIELAFYGSLLIVVICVRFIIQKRRKGH